MNQPKSPNQIKIRITNRCGETCVIPTYRNGCKNAERIWWMKRVPEHRDSHASSSHEPSSEPMRSVDLGKHSVFLTSRKTEIARPESQGPRAEDVLAELQSWCKTWLPNGSSRIRAKQKLPRKPKGACKSSWSQSHLH